MCQLHLTHQYKYNIIKLEVNEYSIKINNVCENEKSYWSKYLTDSRPIEHY